MKKTIKNLIKVAEQNDFVVYIDGNDYDFGKYSDYGQDFHIFLNASNADELVAELDRYVDGFDISEEAYKWLDSSGHGVNGAPYEMIDVYKDMEDCLEMAEELLNEWNNL